MGAAESGITVTELLRWVRRQPAKAPLTAHFFGRVDLKDIWRGWLAEYGTPGAYRRQKPGRWAREVYVHLNSVSMLTWLCERAGVDPPRLARAASRGYAVNNGAAGAGAFRKVVPWAEAEVLLLRSLRGGIDTPADLRAVIARLSPSSPETDRFTAAWERLPPVQQEESEVWYRHQKEQRPGWLGGYSGPGAYGRKDWRRSAAFVYQHVVNPQMLVWLAEALGLPRRQVRLAARLALQRTTMASMSGAIRHVIPWREVEVAILRGRAPRRS